MIEKGSVKRVFPGNNTPRGFVSFYDYIIPQDATRLFVIKGGPGVGKSTFMSTIAKDMIEQGYDVEIHHCSADNMSIDGIVIPSIKVGMLDGTWPHVVDPKVPGAVDEIIWLGDFWDERAVRSNKEAILQAQKGVESVFKRAYRFLKASQVIYEDWESVYVESLDTGKANIIAQRLIKDNFGHIPVAKFPGKERKLFASAITPGGMVNYLNTIVEPCRKRYVIEGNPGTGKSILLDKIAVASLERGLNTEVYYCPLHPDKVEHVIVPDLSLAMTKSIEPHSYMPAPWDEIINMNECVDNDIVERHFNYLVRAQDEFQRLFNSAIYYFGEAKQYHDILEKFYAPNMDFAGIERLRNKILSRIMEYAEKIG